LAGSPDMAVAPGESAWRSQLRPAVEALRSRVRDGGLSVDFPAGLLDGLAATGDQEATLAPIVEQLQAKFDMNAQAFSNDPDPTTTLALAIRGAVDQAWLDSENLILLATWLDSPSSKGPAWLEKQMDVLLRQRGFLIPREVRQRLEVTRRSVHARVLSD